MENLFGEGVKRVFTKPGIYYIKAKDQNYVGSSINIKDRLMEHRQKLSSDKHHSIRMQRIYNKYGQDSIFFSVLEVINTDDFVEIRAAEKKWIDLLGPTLNTELDPTTQNNCTSTSKAVYQYTLEGDFVGKFQSCKEAQRKTNITGTSISACARGKLLSAGKYYWSYKEVPKYSYALERSKWKWRSVKLTDLTTKKSKIFKNIAEAARSIYKKGDNFDSMCASISAVAAGKGKTLWKKYTFEYLN